MTFREDPGPCPVCDAPHTSCAGGEADPRGAGVGVTRGVIVHGWRSRATLAVPVLETAAVRAARQQQQARAEIPVVAPVAPVEATESDSVPKRPVRRRR